MDNSKEYIKMCNHPKIQNKWVLKAGQIYYVDPMMEIFSWGRKGEGNSSGCYIWIDCFEKLGRIPSKKDLQNFIKKSNEKYLNNKLESDYIDLQSEHIKNWKFEEVRSLYNSYRDNTWSIINKIRSEKFYAYGIRKHKSFKVLIKNINYFYIWLPKQDELQKMLSYDTQILIEKFYIFNKNVSNKYSMEQRWLTFVMYKIYKLKWKNNKWEDIK